MGFSSFSETAVFIGVFLFSISFHEASHAFVAYKLGDATAKHQGRITLNPLKHLDFWGTIAIFLIGIGWARPVQINPQNFGDPKRDMMLSALAGPGSNLLLALIAGAILPLVTGITVLEQVLVLLLWVNSLLMLFNLIPIPPLDGSQVLSFFLPSRWRKQWRIIEENGALILILVIALERFFNVPIFQTLIIFPAQKIMAFILLTSSYL